MLNGNRYVVYGAGAVGGVIGARLQLAGRPTTLVARGEHLASIRKNGLRLATADGVHVVEARAVDSAAGVDWSGPPAVLLAVKSHQTSPPMLPQIAGPSVFAPTLSNGYVPGPAMGVADEQASLGPSRATPPDPPG